MRALVLMLSLAGCNQVYKLDETLLADADVRPDLDHDGIADIEDPCIASRADYDEDVDSDGVVNGMDGCPIGPDQTDGDGDGVPDACDPFPTMPGDQYRCVMRLLDPALTATLWQPRPNERELAIAKGYMIGFSAANQPDSSVVAIEPVMPTDGTNIIDVFSGALNTPFRLRVWVSAGPEPSAADVACEVAGNATGTIARTIGTTAATPANGPAVSNTSFIAFRIVVQPGKAEPNLTCMVGYDSTGLSTTGHFDGPLGSFGLSVPGGTGVFSVIEMYHRDDQPALP